MSMAQYLKAKYPGCHVTRPENIYNPHKPGVSWTDYECVTITRDPIDRIRSGNQYFGALRRLSVKQIVQGDWNNSDKYEGVGFADCIGQSDYNHYIRRFEADYGVKITQYRFEDMVNDADFPHINESDTKIQWSEEDTIYVRDQLAKRGITYC
jgi:hypothetical protein